MATIEFWQTVMGRRLIEGTIPKFLDQLIRLNNNLEKLVPEQKDIPSTKPTKPCPHCGHPQHVYFCSMNVSDELLTKLRRGQLSGNITLTSKEAEILVNELERDKT